MTEAEWLACADAAPMLAWLTGGFGAGQPVARPSDARPLASERKLRLFAAACCRAAWPLLTDERSRRAVKVAERFADGLATGGALEAAWRDGWQVVYEGPPAAMLLLSTAAASTCHPEPGHIPGFGPADLLRAGHGTPALQAAVLRDVVGNPWRPAPPESCTECCGGYVPTDRDDNACPCCHGSGRRFPRRWLTPTVLRLARGVYAGRDFGAMPVLADALEEAGCEEGALLWHLRGQYETAPEGRYPAGPHVKGCWAIDLILGKG